MSDYLSDEEQAERLKQWWDDNGTSLIVGLIVAIVAVVGWNYYSEYTTNQREAASDLYEAYLEAKALGQPVDSLLNQLDEEYGSSSYRTFSLLHRAADEVGEENWEVARAHLVVAVEIAQSDLLRDVARFRLAKIDFQLDQLDAALATLGSIGSEGLIAEVAELTGDIHVARGEHDLARDAYQAAVDDARRDPTRPLLGAELLELKLKSLVE